MNKEKADKNFKAFIVLIGVIVILGVVGTLL